MHSQLDNNPHHHNDIIFAYCSLSFSNSYSARRILNKLAKLLALKGVFVVLLYHPIDSSQAGLLLLTQLSELAALFAQGLVHSSVYLTFLKEALKLSNYLSLLGETILHDLHFLQFLLLFQQNGRVLDYLSINFSVILFHCQQTVHP